MLTDASQRQYICPGETHPISQAVHMSRLASFFPACRECPFRCETGQLSQKTVERLQKTEHRVPRKSWLTAEGLRGVYLNELTRGRVSQWASAFAKRLWEQKRNASENPGWRGSGCEKGVENRDDIDTTCPPNREAYLRGASLALRPPPPGPLREPSAPRIVIGHDDRSFAFDLILGVAAALRRMGCAVVDLGLVTRPLLEFACESLNADGGLLVTGAGCRPSWCGIDFFSSAGLPISSAEFSQKSHAITLEDIEQRQRKPVSRPTRQAYPQQTVHAEPTYLTQLADAFHGFRPLRICYASAAELGRSHLELLFAKLSCKLIPVELPHRQRNIHDPEDADVQKLSHQVRQQQAHLGVLIDEDGQHVAFLDEHGRLVAAESLVRLLARHLLESHSTPVIALESEAFPVVKRELSGWGATVVDAGRSAADFVSTMQEPQVTFAAATHGRYWFAEPTVSCDAILTLARVLEALSVSDAPCSQAVI